MSLNPLFNPPSAPTEQQKSEVKNLLGTPSPQSATPVAGASANENATAGKRLLLKTTTSFKTLDELNTRIEAIAASIQFRLLLMSQRLIYS